jgi:DNA gyrase/topoisomerase IV subunit B
MNKKDGSEKQNDSTQKKKKYSSAQDYQVLGGTTKAVRETVGMYIGSTGERG